MKISKRPIKASEVVVEEVALQPEVCLTDNCCPYEKAINSIMCAIESLGEIAKTDAKARESIANLSVVLFDLKS